MLKRILVSTSIILGLYVIVGFCSNTFDYHNWYEVIRLIYAVACIIAVSFWNWQYIPKFKP